MLLEVSVSHNHDDDFTSSPAYSEGYLLDKVDLKYLSFWGYSNRVRQMRESLTSIKSPVLKSRNSKSLGRAYHLMGQHTRSEQHYNESLSIARKTGEKADICMAINQLARAYHLSGRYGEAVDLYREMIAIADEIGYIPAQARRGNLGLTLISLNQFEDAIEVLTQALEIADAHNEVELQCYMGTYLSLAYTCFGDIKQAIQQGKKSREYDSPTNNYRAAAMHGLALIRNGDDKLAKDAFLTCQQLCDEMLRRSPSLYFPKYIRAFSICGTAVATADAEGYLSLSHTAYIDAQAQCSSKGVVDDSKMLLAELIKSPNYKAEYNVLDFIHSRS